MQWLIRVAIFLLITLTESSSDSDGNEDFDEGGCDMDFEVAETEIEEHERTVAGQADEDRGKKNQLHICNSHLH